MVENKNHEGLTDKFARLQTEGRGHVSVALEVFRDIFFPDPPLPPKPTQLKIFAAGLPRSGTGSLAVALKTLGYSPCHGPGTFELSPIFEEHYAGLASNKDIIRHQEQLGFDAQGFDQLGWKLWKEAAEIPDVKIILTEHPRGAEGWAESWSSFVPDHIHHFSQRPFSFMQSMVQMMTLQREFLSYISGMARKYSTPNSNPRDSLFLFPGTGLMPSYEGHKAAVMEAVPAERLLVFKPTQGWAPLCEFLGVEPSACPTNREYPGMTDRQLMMTMSNVAQAFIWIWPLGVLAAIFPIVIILRRIFPSRNLPKKKIS